MAHTLMTPDPVRQHCLPLPYVSSGPASTKKRVLHYKKPHHHHHHHHHTRTVPSFLRSLPTDGHITVGRRLLACQEASRWGS